MYTKKQRTELKNKLSRKLVKLNKKLKLASTQERASLEAEIKRIRAQYTKVINGNYIGPTSQTKARKKRKNKTSGLRNLTKSELEARIRQLELHISDNRLQGNTDCHQQLRSLKREYTHRISGYRKPVTIVSGGSTGLKK